MHSIKQIQIVQALALHRHFGRAASALGVSQPNLTRSLKHMEEVLGVALFDRQGVTPTLFGEIVLRHGERAKSNFDELIREISLVKGLEVGELRISVGPYPADISGAKAVGRLLGKNPKLFIELRGVNWANAVEEVVEGVIDLALAELSATPSSIDIEIEPVRKSKMIFFCVAGHPLATRKTVFLDDLLEFPWAGPDLPSRMVEALPKEVKPFAVFHEELARLRPRALIGSFADAKQIVLHGTALSVAIPFQIERELKDGVYVQLPIDLPWMTLNYGFVYKRGRRLSPAALAFMDTVRDIEREIP